MTDAPFPPWSESYEPEREGDQFMLDVRTGYEQGRGAFGGLVLGALTRAMEVTLGDATRTLRSLTAEIVGPVLPGRSPVEATVLRAGNAVTTLVATLKQNGETLVHAIGVFGRHRGFEIESTRERRIDAGDWRKANVVDIGPPMAPVFAQHVEFRPGSPFPFAGGDVAEATAWIRPKSRGTVRGDAYLVTMADAVWPAVFATLTTPRPVATIAFSFQIVGSLAGLDPEAPFLHKARLLGSSEGYMVELRELYGEDGRLLALNEQTFVVIK